MSAQSTTMARSKAKARRKHTPARHAPRLLTAWQRALIWAAWLSWVWLLWRNTASVSMGGLEFLGLIAAIAVTIVCKRYPQGVPAVFIEEPEQMRGAFESRTNWALVLAGAGILLGGIASTMRIIIHLSTGFATVKDVFNDIGVFIVQWVAERLSGGTYDGELEKTQAYILCILLIPGIFMVLVNLMPLFNRGRRFQAGEDGSLAVQDGDSWKPVYPLQYAVVTADGTSLEFKDSETAPAALSLPMWRVFSLAKGTRVKSRVLAQWLRRELERQGFSIESRSPQDMVETAWIARRPE